MPEFDVSVMVTERSALIDQYLKENPKAHITDIYSERAFNDNFEDWVEWVVTGREGEFKFLTYAPRNDENVKLCDIVKYKFGLLKPLKKVSHVIKNDDILVSRWGYGERYVSFYIASVHKRDVRLYELKSAEVKRSDGIYVIPAGRVDEGSFGHGAMKEVNEWKDTEYVPVNDFELAYPWNGEPIQIISANL